MSLTQEGYLEYGLNLLMTPGRNCLMKRGFSDQKSRISGMPKRTIAIRSSPKPNAQPILSEWPAKNLPSISRRESKFRLFG